MKYNLLILLYLCTIALARNCTKSNEKTICSSIEGCVGGVCVVKLKFQPRCAEPGERTDCFDNLNCKTHQCLFGNNDCAKGESKPLPSSSKTIRNCCRGLKLNPITGRCYQPCTNNNDCRDTYRVIHTLPVLSVCANNICLEPKHCGVCGSYPVDGLCCDGNPPDGLIGFCSCDCKSNSDCQRYMFCEKSRCRDLYPGKTCGACGKKPVQGRCCTSRELQSDTEKPCFCKPRQGVQCTADKFCGPGRYCRGDTCSSTRFL